MVLCVQVLDSCCQMGVAIAARYSCPYYTKDIEVLRFDDPPVVFRRFVRVCRASADNRPASPVLQVGASGDMLPIPEVQPNNTETMTAVMAHLLRCLARA